MNFHLIAKILSRLLLVQVGAMLLCAGFAYWAGWQASGAEQTLEFGAGYGLLIAAAITGLVASMLFLTGISKVKKILRREGLVVVGLSWLVFGVFGSLPFMIAPPGLAPAAAFFESVSGFTTTGSTVIASLGEWPRGILLWRAVSQFLGGVGILVLFVALLSSLGGGVKTLFRAESSLQTGEATTARIADTAKVLLRVYLVFNGLCIVGLKILGMSWFDAVTHGMCACATGGFSPHDASIGFYSSWDSALAIELWLCLFMVMCSLNFLLFPLLLQNKWRAFWSNDEARWFLSQILLFTLVATAAIQLNEGSWAGSLATLRGVFFTCCSIMTTCGFGSMNYDQWPTFGLILLIFMMLQGGCSGSTSGGLKVSRLIILMKSIRSEVVMAFRPGQVFRMQMNQRPISESVRHQAVFFLTLNALIFLASVAMVALLELNQGIDFTTSFGCVFATLTNIGPGFGDVGASGNFAHLQPLTQLFLAGLMVLGRLELFAVLVLFVPALWKRY